jgi:BirA family biotin operon repressor/biotin-[acetyl-CoA-carboxylase] ligase
VNGIDRLLPSRIKEHVAAWRFGRRIYYYPETISTNRVALDLARSGEAEGALVVADYQTRGRGRLDRDWSSPAGKDLLFTLVLRPAGEPTAVLPITLVFSTAVSIALSHLLGIEVGVKWPNDMIVRGGKIGGILAEGVTVTERSSFVVLGTGINVNSESEDFPEEIRDRTVSCRSVSGRVWDRARVLADVLDIMEAQYERFQKDGFASVRNQYEEKLVVKGRRVSFERDGARLHGTVDGVNDDGALRVIPPGGGNPLALYSGEVRLEK